MFKFFRKIKTAQTSILDYKTNMKSNQAQLQEMVAIRSKLTTSDFVKIYLIKFYEHVSFYKFICIKFDKNCQNKFRENLLFFYYLIISVSFLHIMF